MHSPLAFRIVTECVSPPRGYAFYADDLIDAKYSGQPREKRFERIKLRLANLIHPSHLDCVADRAGLLRLAPKLVGSEDYTILIGSRLEKSDIDLLPGVTLAILGRRFTIIARRPGMNLVSYTVL